jgi:flagellar assembly protein FliH
MAKAVFRSGEILEVSEAVLLEPPTSFELANSVEPEEEAQQEESSASEEEVYTGPTAEELRREAEEFKSRWEFEREEMVQAARNEAEAVRAEAEEMAAMKLQQAEEETERLKTRAVEESEKILADANAKVQEIEAEVRKSLETERQESLASGKEEGRVEGYAEGKAEADRLIDRVQVVLERAQDKRGEILSETERQIIDLVLLITRKVVKVISETQREVVIANVLEALRKVRERGTVIVRVNLADAQLTTEHTKEFIKSLEGITSIQVQEDTSIDVGGCIVETDFGEIDARISSQLAELEAKILEISPIKTKLKLRQVSSEPAVSVSPELPPKRATSEAKRTTASKSK